MIIKKKMEENTLTISLDGRLDTNTAPELEKELESLDEIQNLIFDFENLEYISSAGLRIILVLQKMMNNQRSMTIINVKDEVREVFEMTGFCDIIDIR